MNYVWRNNPSIVARLVNTKKVQTISKYGDCIETK